MKTFIAHWKKMGVKFDCIFTGFFGNVGQIEMAMDLIRDFAHDDTVVLVDPVIGDNGALYGFFGEEYIEAMRKLASMAHVTTPNRTEAALLASCPMDAPAPVIMDAFMSRLQVPNAVITSVAFDGDGNFADPSSSKKIGYLARTSSGLVRTSNGPARTSSGLAAPSGHLYAANSLSADSSKTAFGSLSATGDLIIAKDLRPYKLHGTGDVFASALCGELMAGELTAGASGSGTSDPNTSGSAPVHSIPHFYDAVCGAADFCDQCVEATIKKQPGHWYGLAYEDVIASKR